MENEQIISYVTGLVQSGKSKQEIKERLLAVGWSENDIDAAYTRALVSSGVPVPSDAMQSTFAKKSSTVEIFVNLFSFILLGIVATALGTLFFQVINKYFPDPLLAGSYKNRISTDAIHYSIAALLIGFPLYYLSLRFWFRGFQRDEGKVETLLTRLLTYLVLLIASVVIVGDLIVTVFTFLQGEISVRFFLKALVIFVITGTIFGFYFLERRKIQYRKPISQFVFKGFGLAVSLLVLLAIVLGFFAGGSPATERKRGFDEQRESDLSEIANCVGNYAQQFKRLPDSLDELEKNSSFSYCAFKRDPETKKPYSYRVIDKARQVGPNLEGEFELCANFSLASEGGENYNRGYSYYGVNQKWQEHGAGLACDAETVVIQTSRDLQ